MTKDNLSTKELMFPVIYIYVYIDRKFFTHTRELLGCKTLKCKLLLREKQ